MASKHQQLLADIKAHPEKHRHAFEQLQECATYDGALDLAVMQAHEGLCGYNGQACDVVAGPCSCGSVH